MKNIYQTKSGTFKVQIKHQGVIKYFGCFKTLKEAEEMATYVNKKYKRRDYVLSNSNSH